MFIGGGGGGVCQGPLAFVVQKLLVVHRTNMKTYGDRAFSIAGPKLWNQLPLSIRELSSIDSFKKSLKTYLFRLAYS